MALGTSLRRVLTATGATSSDSQGGQALQVVPEYHGMPASGSSFQVPGTNPVMSLPPTGSMALAGIQLGAPISQLPWMTCGGAAASTSSSALSPGSAPSRLACLARYRKKKASRTYGKHIRYQMRKVNADRRPRVKGRFIKADAVA